jgi:tRNA modification GTPase
VTTTYFSSDTIAAAATALGGPVAIVRISGPQALSVLRSLSGLADLNPRSLTRAHIRASDGRALDEGLVVSFPGPDSFTGENCAELHLHGGSFGVRQVLDELFKLGVRQALPGEFSFRAVRNGKMRLEQAQAVADLISAPNADAVSLALEKFSGLQSRVTGKIASELKRLATLGEVGIDFADQDVDEVGLPALKRAIGPLLESLETVAESFSRGSRLQEGIRVAFIGLPNAGKSSFFNALLGEDRSIVSELPGTTRDVVHEKMTLKSGGASVTLRLEDTAGLRATEERVERIGIERSLSAATAADLVLFVADVTESPGTVLREWARLERTIPRLAEKTLGIQTKIDLVTSPPAAPFPLACWVRTSAVTGQGIPEAIQSIIAAAEGWVRRTPGELLLTRQDQFDAARAGALHLKRALDAPSIDLFAADLRQALVALGPVIGETPADEILGRIFSDFCIGK